MALLGFIGLLALETWAPALPRAVRGGLPALCIVAGVLLTGSRGERWFGGPRLSLLGDASYALYLCHPFVANAILLFWFAFAGRTAAWAFFWTAAIASIVCSVLVYLALEKPILAFLKRRLVAPRAQRDRNMTASVSAHFAGDADAAAPHPRDSAADRASAG
ncbi:MAG: acyltransferase family protein [Hyphomonadaceae bacterium]